MNKPKVAAQEETTTSYENFCPEANFEKVESSKGKETTEKPKGHDDEGTLIDVSLHSNECSFDLAHPMLPTSEEELAKGKKGNVDRESGDHSFFYDDLASEREEVGTTPKKKSKKKKKKGKALLKGERTLDEDQHKEY